jgi:hypothetical protein
MKNKFYFIGTVIGLICVPLVAYAILLDSLLGLFGSVRFSVPIGIGYLACLTIARCFDHMRKFNRKPNLLVDPILFVIIILFGAAMGSLANFFISGDILSPPFGLLNELWGWFGKPLYGLTIYGAPCAALIGVTHTAVCRCLWAKNRG